MTEHGVYFADSTLYDLIRSVGGTCNDSKERPLLCLIKSAESDDLYWAIPMGNWDHRTQEGKDRIQKYLNHPSDDIRSCYYHLGNTDVRSIFFISDAIPITDKYIKREYLNHYSNRHQIIKNPKLISELERKLFRILSDENLKPNSYRQHITAAKEVLISKKDS